MLAQLAPLGLRTSVTTDTLLQAARHVEELMAVDEPMAWARCGMQAQIAIYNMTDIGPSAFASPSLYSHVSVAALLDVSCAS